jgi:acyl dehydratase
MLVVSYGIGLLPLDPERVVALRGMDGVVFKRPVHIGDTIHVEGAIDAIRPLDEGFALVDLGWRIKNQSGVTVARATLHAVWRHESAPEEPERLEPGPERRTGSGLERQEVFL